MDGGNEEEDMHICLACQVAIVGLENYVLHKKQSCPVKKATQNMPKLSQQASGHILTDLRPQVTQYPLSNDPGNLQTFPPQTYSLDLSLGSGISKENMTTYGVTLPNVHSSSGGFSSPDRNLSFSQVMDNNLDPTLAITSPRLFGDKTTAPVVSGLGDGGILTVCAAGNHSADVATGDINLGQVPSFSNSPNKFSTVDPNMVLCDIGNHESTTSTLQIPAPVLSTSTPSIIDFLSSLELQCRTPSHGKCSASADRLGLDSMDERDNRVPDNLKLANLLNDLNFDSDSEGFDMPSDAEDLLNFSEDDYCELDHSSPTSGVGYKGKGKGKGRIAIKTEPVESTTDKIGQKGGKAGTTGGKLTGKWRPGERPPQGKWPHSIGKRHYEESSSEGEEGDDSQINTCESEKASKELSPVGGKFISKKGRYDVTTETPIPNPSEDADTLNEINGEVNSTSQQNVSENMHQDDSLLDQEVGEGDNSHIEDQVEDDFPKKLPIELRCEPCDKVFRHRLALINHVRSAAHLDTINEVQAESIATIESGSVVKKETNGSRKVLHLECPSCQKVFKNKYNLVRHLLSSLHNKKSKTPVLCLEPSFQRIFLRMKPFQCRICQFFCNDYDDLIRHMDSAIHLESIEDLVGPMLCVLCRYSSNTTDGMMTHFLSDAHNIAVSKSSRPCIIREIRNNLTCSMCNKHFSSAKKLQVHLDSKHPKQDRTGKRVTKPSYELQTSDCPICGLHLKKKSSLLVHLRRKHTGERPFRCETCQKGYCDPSTLTKHYQSQKHINRVLSAATVPSDNQTEGTVLPFVTTTSADMQIIHTCQSCDFNSTSFTEMKTHFTEVHKRQNMYKCRKCDFSVTSYTELRPHYIAAHRNDRYNCDLCGLKFLSEKVLNKHSQSNKHTQTLADSKLSGGTCFPCLQCGYKFYAKEKLSYHTLSHMPEVSAKGKKLAGIPDRFHQFVMEDLKRKKAHEEVVCPECEKTFKMGNMLPHLRSHGDDTNKPYKCNFCPKTFCSTGSLSRHQKTHLHITNFRCQFCSKGFRFQGALLTHEKQLHPTKTTLHYKYQCEYCSRGFMEKTRLTLHQKNHMEKEWKCTFEGCARAFAFQSSLDIHMRVHTGRRPYLCDQCGFKTKTTTHMARHRRSHTGERKYVCDYCPYKATFSSGLRRHMRIHAGSKPFKCPHCDYTCNNLSNLRLHIKRAKQHAGLSIYTCHICGYGSNEGRQFQNHMIIAHQVPAADVEFPSIYVGIYVKNEDQTKVQEGSQVLPVKEKNKTGRPSQKVQKFHDQQERLDTEMNRPKFSVRNLYAAVSDKEEQDGMEWHAASERREQQAMVAGYLFDEDRNNGHTQTESKQQFNVHGYHNYNRYPDM